jgi:hypothetical protein
VKKARAMAIVFFMLEFLMIINAQGKEKRVNAGQNSK